MASLRTYDVFDTCITRMVGEPVSAFLLLGNELVADGTWRGSAEQFAAARVEAETRARIHAWPREVRFAEIYHELQNAYALDAPALARISASELTVERSLLRRVPGIAEELAQARARGATVQFISDMYLPHDVLRAWLVELGVLQGDETLWLSSSDGTTKGGGGLFDSVRRAHPDLGEDWTHVGDNAHSDVAVPRGRGIAVRQEVGCHLTADEKVMEQRALETCGLGSALAGAARWTRLHKPVGVDEALHDLATGIGGPVVYSFVLWVLLEARRRGLRKIWFMARDGQVMLPVARTIAARLGMDVDLGYLYGGRQVVRVASLVSIDDHALDWLTGGAGLMTLQAVLDRVGVSVAEVAAVASASGLPADSVIGWERVDALKRFLQHPDVAPKILAEAADRRVTVLDYFRSCGLIEGGSCAVVDIGWKGNVLRSIVDLVGIEAASRHTFMYFGAYAHVKSCEAVPRIAYLFDIRHNRRVGVGDDIPSMTTLMEIICQADHGSVMKVERRGERFEPVCRPVEGSADGARWNVAHFQQAIINFADAVPIERFQWTSIDLRGLCDRLLRRLAVHPTPAEIDLLAPIGFVDDQGGSQPQAFAHAYDWSQLRLAFRSGESTPRLGLNWWIAAAVALTPAPVRGGMRLAAKLGRLRAQRRAAVSRDERAAS